MDAFFDKLAVSWTNSVMWMVCFGAVFWLLTAIWPCNKDIKWRKEPFLSDLGYWFILPILYAYVRVGVLVAAAIHLFNLEGETLKDFIDNGYGVLATWPLWVQMIAILVLSDIYLYWMHRVFHRGVWWRFHSVHHSTKDLDWISTARFHPVNYIISFVFIDVIMLLLGFAPAALIALAPINAILSAFVHANLNWTLGPLKYVIATPVFHRWHHVSGLEGRDTNFAPTFPVLDILFGTFYMPKGKLPAEYGISEPMSERFWGQMVHPFTPRKRAKK